MSDYSQFIDDQVKKHKQAQEDEENIRREKKASDDAALEALASPLDSVLTPALQEAERQLVSKGIQVDRTSPLSYSEVGDFKVFRHFRLKKPRDRGGYFSTELYFFRVYPKGNIEAGVFGINAAGRQDSTRILLKTAEAFRGEDVEQVVKEAITALIAKIE